MPVGTCQSQKTSMVGQHLLLYRLSDCQSLTTIAHNEAAYHGPREGFALHGWLLGNSSDKS